MGLFPVAGRSTVQGDIGVACAIRWFTVNGYVVCIPVSEHQDFDLVVVGEAGVPQKVQVKTTRGLEGSNFEVQLSTCGGNRSNGTKVKPFTACTADLLFVVTDSGDEYLIPRSVITATRCIVLGEKYQSYRVF